MRQKELLDSIKKFLARFEAQVKISSLNKEYDINVHSENVIIPILNLVFDVELINANIADPNAEAIDLIDQQKKVAFQVTSTKKIDKVQKTLIKLLSSKYKNQVQKLYIYILRDKQASYSQEAIAKITKSQIEFNVDEHIIDGSDIYRLIVARNDLSLIEKVEEVLRKQFTDVFISETFTVKDLENFRLGYYRSCFASFSRINFFGLSVRTKPREVELYDLFVVPTLSLRKQVPSYDLEAQEFILSTDFKLSFEQEKRSPASTRDIYHSALSEFLVSRIDVSGLFAFPAKKESLGMKEMKILFERQAKLRETPFRNLFSGPKNIVILGKPGAGKSSLIKFSICKILDKDLSVFSNQQMFAYIPFRIELHKYSKQRKADNLGILNYLSEILRAEYQQRIDPNDLKYIVNTFPTLLFFDGLDEIFDVHDRIEVRNEIESFLGSYPKLRAVVSSRYESYQEVQLSDKLFTTYELLDFNDTQVADYVSRWYQLEENDETVRKIEIEDCLLQLKSVDSELRYNPLLLALILLLYRNELDIPTSKLSIYESCTNTIVDTRDNKEKKLNLKISILNKIAVFASLAYWQFTNETNGKPSPTYEGVRSYIKNYLLAKGEFSDEHFAATATDEFLQFAQLRSIYFENKFTHKTFLEYFTAYYIYSHFYSKHRSQFYDLFSESLGYSSWSVVLELLLCMVDAGQIDYEVVDNLIDRQFSENEVDSLIFFLPVLKYLRNISPTKIKFIISQGLKYSFNSNGRPKELKKDYREIIFSYLASLGTIDRFKPVIEKCFSEEVETNGIPAPQLTIFGYEFAMVSGNTSLVEHLQSSTAENEYIFILKHYPHLFQRAKYIDALSLFVREFGPDGIVQVYKSHFRQKIFFSSHKFNWITSYLSTYLSEVGLPTLYDELVSTGIKLEHILASIKQDGTSLDPELFSASLDTKPQKAHKELKRIVKAVLAAHFQPKSSAKNTTSFYDKLFINPLKRRT